MQGVTLSLAVFALVTFGWYLFANKIYKEQQKENQCKK